MPPLPQQVNLPIPQNTAGQPPQAAPAASAPPQTMPQGSATPETNNLQLQGADPVVGILRPLQIAPEMKANIYKAYQGAKDQQGFIETFRGLDAPPEVKASLYKLRFAPPIGDAQGAQQAIQQAEQQRQSSPFMHPPQQVLPQQTPEFERLATEAGLGLASGFTSMPETMQPLQSAKEGLQQEASQPVAQALRDPSLYLGPGYGMAQGLYRAGSELLNPQSRDPQEAMRERVHGLFSGIGQAMQFVGPEHFLRGEHAPTVREQATQSGVRPAERQVSTQPPAPQQTQPARTQIGPLQPSVAATRGAPPAKGAVGTSTAGETQARDIGGTTARARLTEALGKRPGAPGATNAPTPTVQPTPTAPAAARPADAVPGPAAAQAPAGAAREPLSAPAVELQRRTGPQVGPPKGMEERRKIQERVRSEDEALAAKQTPAFEDLRARERAPGGRLSPEVIAQEKEARRAEEKPLTAPVGKRSVEQAREIVDRGEPQMPKGGDKAKMQEHARSRDEYLASKAQLAREDATKTATTPQPKEHPLHQTLTRFLKTPGRTDEFYDALDSAKKENRPELAEEFTKRANRADATVKHVREMQDVEDLDKYIREQLASPRVLGQKGSEVFEAKRFVPKPGAPAKDTFSPGGGTAKPKIVREHPQELTEFWNLIRGRTMQYVKGLDETGRSMKDLTAKHEDVRGGVKKAKADLDKVLRDIQAAGGKYTDEQQERATNALSLLTAATGKKQIAGKMGGVVEGPAGEPRALGTAQTQAWLNAVMGRPRTSHFAKPSPAELESRISYLERESKASKLVAEELGRKDEAKPVESPKEPAKTPEKPVEAAKPVPKAPVAKKAPEPVREVPKEHAFAADVAKVIPGEGFVHGAPIKTVSEFLKTGIPIRESEEGLNTFVARLNRPGGYGASQTAIGGFGPSSRTSEVYAKSGDLYKERPGDATRVAYILDKDIPAVQRHFSDALGDFMENHPTAQKAWAGKDSLSKEELRTLYDKLHPETTAYAKRVGAFETPTAGRSSEMIIPEELAKGGVAVPPEKIKGLVYDGPLPNIVAEMRKAGRALPVYDSQGALRLRPKEVSKVEAKAEPRKRTPDEEAELRDLRDIKAGMAGEVTPQQMARVSDRIRELEGSSRPKEAPKPLAEKQLTVEEMDRRIKSLERSGKFPKTLERLKESYEKLTGKTRPAAAEDILQKEQLEQAAKPKVKETLADRLKAEKQAPRTEPLEIRGEKIEQKEAGEKLAEYLERSQLEVPGLHDRVSQHAQDYIAHPIMEAIDRGDLEAVDAQKRYSRALDIYKEAIKRKDTLALAKAIQYAKEGKVTPPRAGERGSSTPKPRRGLKEAMRQRAEEVEQSDKKPSLLERLKATSDNFEKSRVLDEGLQKMQFQREADKMRQLQGLRELQKLSTPSEQKKMYRSMEPRGEKFTQRQQIIYDHSIRDWADQAEADREWLGKHGHDVDNYVRRIAIRKNTMWDRIVRGKGNFSLGSALKTTASAMKGRSYFELTHPGMKDGIIAHVDDKGHVTLWENGRPEPMDMTRKQLEANGAKFQTAVTDDITRHAGQDYIQHLYLNTSTSAIELRSARRATEFLEAYKASPEFKEISVKANPGDPIPDGFSHTKVPQLAGYAFEKHTAEVLDNYYDKLGKTDASWLEDFNNFLTTTIYWNPLKHGRNVLDHWSTHHGLSTFLNPAQYRPMARAMLRAGKAVIQGNTDYLHAWDSGMPLRSRMTSNSQLTKVMMNELRRGLKGPEGKAVAAAWGMHPAQMYKRMLDAQRKALFGFDDILRLQAVYHHAEMTGDSFQKSWREISKHLPDYTIPTHVGVKVPGTSINIPSRALAKGFSSKALMFGRYHFGRLKSYGYMANDLLSKDVPTKERAKSIDRMLMVAVTMYAYSTLGKMVAQKLTQNKNAEMSPSGAAAIPWQIMRLAQGKTTLGRAFTSTFTPSPILDFAGRMVYGQRGSAKPIGKQVKEAGRGLVEEIGPVKEATRSGFDWREAARRALLNVYTPPKKKGGSGLPQLGRIGKL